jgi:hypothetical protein
MTDVRQLTSVIVGLLGFAATQEQVLLAASPAQETGSPQSWAAAPLIAHSTEFKRQQVQRLQSIEHGSIPPEFGEVDHTSAQLYQRFAGQPAAAVARDSREVSAQLADGVLALCAEDLLDPSRHPWLRGRQLWLQIIVRGFWHPTGHLGEYYLGHGQPARAVRLAAQGVAAAEYLSAPDMARGMASYNLACASARAGRTDEAAAALRDAIRLNADLKANAARDPDLAGVSEDQVS